MLLITFAIIWIGCIVWFVKSIGGDETIDEYGNITSKATRKHLKRMEVLYH